MRPAFLKELERAAEDAARHNAPLSLAIIDFDRFKSVNDTYGHAAGDVVLERGSKIIADNLRAPDVLGRWGGEELVVLFPNLDVEAAIKLLRKALGRFREELFAADDGRTFHVSFSAGVSAVRPQVTPDQAFAAADRSLFRAKNAGRSLVLSEETTVPGSVRRVLLVEHDAGLAMVIGDLLGANGIEVTQVADRAAAITATAADADLAMVLVDVTNPAGDGFELLRDLRALDRLAALPILMLVGMQSEEAIRRGMDLGASDYILKPLSPPDLQVRVGRALRLGRC